MIVVADTSPVKYLMLIQEIDVLPKIYGRVVTPKTVREELERASAPQLVRSWLDRMPDWLEVRTPPSAPDLSLASLMQGSAMRLRLQWSWTLINLIVDGRVGRREAERRGIPVIGTLGALREAATLRFLDIRVAVERLQTTSFFVAPEVLESLLKDFS